MITNVSMLNFKPSFGLAKLSKEGANAAAAFGYPANNFLNDDLFCKQKRQNKKYAFSASYRCWRNIRTISKRLWLHKRSKRKC